MSALRTTAVIALGVGAAGSVGFMFHASQRIGSPPLLVGLFAMWIVSPFVILAAGYVLSKRWSPLTRATLHLMTPIVTVLSLAIYGAAAFGAARPKTAVFVIVAPATWLLIAIVVATAAFLSQQAGFRSQRRTP